MLLSVWNEVAFQYWILIAACAVIIWAYYEFWVSVLQPWFKRRFTEVPK